MSTAPGTKCEKLTKQLRVTFNYKAEAPYILEPFSNNKRQKMIKSIQINSEWEKRNSDTHLIVISPATVSRPQQQWLMVTMLRDE